MRGSKYTIESLAKIANEYNTRIDFKKQKSGAYRAAIVMGVLDQICSNMVSGRLLWTDEKIKAEALKYKSRWEFQKNSKGAYLSAFNSGNLDKFCKHMNILCGPKWGKKELKEEAEKYSTKAEFCEKNQYAYKMCIKYGIIVKADRKVIQRKNPWKHEEIKAEALKYSTKIEFLRQSPKAYKAAVLRNVLDEMTQHMVRLAGSSTQEKDLFSAIKEKYPKTLNLKDRKVKIEGKPLIKGFDIDIYVPELRKGIEFDGTYYHSVPGLARGRPNWPQDDLENYHQIKDEYFKSKGIELLHISEEEWLKDQSKCVKKCMEFLNER